MGKPVIEITIVIDGISYSAQCEQGTKVIDLIAGARKSLNLSKKWDIEIYPVGLDWDDTIETRQSLVFERIFTVKVHYGGKKHKVLCRKGVTATQIISEAARHIGLPPNTEAMITNDLDWSSVFNSDGEIFLQ